MIKKALIGSAVLLAVGTLVFGRDVFSYVKTCGTSVREAVKREVPLEFEVQRARETVEDLVPDIRNCMHVIAEQQVDIEHLEGEIARKTNEISRQKEAILALRNDLETGKSNFVYASRVYSSVQVKRDLAVRFERFKNAEEMLSRDRQILQAKRQTLVHNEEKLDRMLGAKKDLEVKIEQLESRLKAVQAAQAATLLEIDDSQLARAKKLIREINKQLDVREKMLDAEGKFPGLIPVDTEPEIPVENITEEIDEYFNGNEAGDAAEGKVAEADPAA